MLTKIKMIDQSTNQRSDSPINWPFDQSINWWIHSPIECTSRWQTDLPTDQPTDRLNERPDDEPIYQSPERLTDQPTNDDRPTEWSNERSDDEPIHQSTKPTDWTKSIERFNRKVFSFYRNYWWKFKQIEKREIPLHKKGYKKTSIKGKRRERSDKASMKRAENSGPIPPSFSALFLPF